MDSYYNEFLPLIPPPSEDALAALATARGAGCKICIVTNGSSRAQEPKITEAIAAAVDGWVISEIVGVGKPDPAVFRAAAEAVGAELTEAFWVVGDRAETDVFGAVRAGVNSAWIARGRTWDESLPYRPTIEAPNLPEAVAAILGG